MLSQSSKAYGPSGERFLVMLQEGAFDRGVMKAVDNYIAETEKAKVSSASIK